MDTEAIVRQLRAEIFPKLTKGIILQGAVNVILAIGIIIALIFATNKRQAVVGITDSGRVIPLVSLDKPHVNDSRVVAFADECVRLSFNHDFVNFRQSMTGATKCFTTDGARSFTAALAPWLKEMERGRYVMSVTLRPPTVLQTSQSGGVYRWVVQTEMTLFREGTQLRLTPTPYQVDLIVERVPLEEDVRGISVSQINVKPAVRVSSSS